MVFKATYLKVAFSVLAVIASQKELVKSAPQTKPSKTSLKPDAPQQLRIPECKKHRCLCNGSVYRHYADRGVFLML